MVKASGVELVSGPVDKALQRLYVGMGTASIIGAMGVIHEHFTSKSAEMFSNEKDPWGNDWAALSEATKQIRINLKFPPGPINTRTGRLRDHFVTARPDIIGSSDSVVSYAYPTRAFPDRDIFKRLEQASGLNPRGPTARRVVGMDETDIAVVLTTLSASIFTAGIGK